MAVYFLEEIVRRFPWTEQSILDHKETELRAEESESRSIGAARLETPLPERAVPKTSELLRQGEELCAAGRHQEAIHVWTRILFLDRGNHQARQSIEKAKLLIAEQQRRLDLETAEASRLYGSGDLQGARALLCSVLAADASLGEAVQLAAKISAQERRSEASREAAPAAPAPQAEPQASRKVVVRVSKARSRPSRAAGPSASRPKMTAFLLGAVLVFAASAMVLHRNWDRILSDGAFGHSGAELLWTLSEPESPQAPDLAELRYYNGERLYAEGRYREALSELGRIDRGSPWVEEARSLILRIEERLLRGAGDPADGSVRPGPFEVKP